MLLRGQPKAGLRNLRRLQNVTTTGVSEEEIYDAPVKSWPNKPLSYIESENSA
jgi:hypothetical protein